MHSRVWSFFSDTINIRTQLFRNKNKLSIEAKYLINKWENSDNKTAILSNTCVQYLYSHIFFAELYYWFLGQKAEKKLHSWVSEWNTNRVIEELGFLNKPYLILPDIIIRYTTITAFLVRKKFSNNTRRLKRPKSLSWLIYGHNGWYIQLYFF